MGKMCSFYMWVLYPSLYTCIHIHTLSSLEPVKSPRREGLQGNQSIDTRKVDMKGSRKKKVFNMEHVHYVLNELGQ